MSGSSLGVGPGVPRDCGTARLGTGCQASLSLELAESHLPLRADFILLSWLMVGSPLLECTLNNRTFHCLSFPEVPGT
jgi:hypothetical protein